MASLEFEAFPSPNGLLNPGLPALPEPVDRTNGSEPPEKAAPVAYFLAARELQSIDEHFLKTLVGVGTIRE